MKKRQRKKYEKEIEETLEKHFRILQHHLSQNFQRFANEVYKINSRYFNLTEEDLE